MPSIWSTQIFALKSKVPAISAVGVTTFTLTLKFVGAVEHARSHHKTSLLLPIQKKGHNYQNTLWAAVSILPPTSLSLNFHWKVAQWMITSQPPYPQLIQDYWHPDYGKSHIPEPVSEALIFPFPENLVCLDSVLVAELSSTMKVLRFYPTYKLTSQPVLIFINAGRRPSTLRSVIKDFIFQIRVSNMYIYIFLSTFSSLQVDKDDRKGLDTM